MGSVEYKYINELCVSPYHVFRFNIPKPLNLSLNRRRQSDVSSNVEEEMLYSEGTFLFGEKKKNEKKNSYHTTHV